MSAFAGNVAAKDGLQGQCRACAALTYRNKRIAAGAVVLPTDVPAGHEFCRTCGESKTHASFSRYGRSTDGLQSRCKACASERGKSDHLRWTYGLTQEDVIAMTTRQDGVGAICLTAPPIHVDHDHATGKVRGLLCFRCNAALGQLDDDPATLRRAARYLDRSRSSAAVSPRTVRVVSTVSMVTTESPVVFEFDTAVHRRAS